MVSTPTGVQLALDHAELGFAAVSGVSTDTVSMGPQGRTKAGPTVFEAGLSPKFIDLLALLARDTQGFL
ncbi:hypothetical protein FXN63_11880 [Pigmentiphaga aceris]|uniref:Uncharacterized protein n=1 Tax=Pigmentiphaga aceris TaxID=1940612 RepID=A0A5C0AYI2_9BURK|nr:hypothetical protein [Pigmentiphaga aceris]QEI06453.1 hypothetical protein FXN63_11880 [Pigmentiphaga aceris]